MPHLIPSTPSRSQNRLTRQHARLRHQQTRKGGQRRGLSLRRPGDTVQQQGRENNIEPLLRQLLVHRNRVVPPREEITTHGLHLQPRDATVMAFPDPRRRRFEARRVEVEEGDFRVRGQRRRGEEVARSHADVQDALASVVADYLCVEGADGGGRTAPDVAAVRAQDEPVVDEVEEKRVVDCGAGGGWAAVGLGEPVFYCGAEEGEEGEDG